VTGDSSDNREMKREEASLGKGGVCDGKGGKGGGLGGKRPVQASLGLVQKEHSFIAGRVSIKANFRGGIGMEWAGFWDRKNGTTANNRGKVLKK